MGLSSWLEHYLIAEQTTAVSLTLLIYDWTLTLDREVKYFWVGLQTLTIPKALYFLVCIGDLSDHRRHKTSIESIPPYHR
ncbi:hypothetical protein SISNIDRAFT_451194 [Sistotremastrum niveocremeum HHB9708]|uniref:DUF6533 domain-containing protein n=1 Tax=Sistotremastrum niveocremeum HHB9708 TaxID=1314777 RepID=A0A164Y043_9AGAM|nr:hypothetical protein SISNIDRAFT_451194 [Sistotremastrum niveocremeum HHB9708]